MKSSLKRYRFSSRKEGRQAILEGVDEESRMYFTVFGGPVEKSRKRLQKLTLKDIPLAVRRKEAEKPTYLIRYE